MVSLVFSAPRSLVAILSLMQIVMTIPEAALWVWASSEGYSSCPLLFLPLKGGVVIYLSYLHYISYLLSIYQSVNLFLCLSVCRSVGRSVHIYIYIYIYQSHIYIYMNQRLVVPPRPLRWWWSLYASYIYIYVSSVSYIYIYIHTVYTCGGGAWTRDTGL